MSTSAVSSASIFQELQSFFQQRSGDLSQLGNALQSGDLNSAQQAYNSLVTLGQGGPFASGDPFRNSTREQDFSAIGQALQSGDISGAQQAFTQLESTFQRQSSTQNTPTQNGSTQGGSAANSTSSSAGPDVIINLELGQSISNPTAGSASSNSTASDSPEIVINIGDSGGPEQVTIDLSNQSNGSEQLSINVANQNQPPQQPGMCQRDTRRDHAAH